MKNVTGKIFNIQRYSLDDGEGIRTCVFLKGCPLHCLWCHNAESQSPHIELAYRRESCIGCGECARVCELGCHKLGELHIFERENCTVCNRCANVCPTEALELVGKHMSIDAVMSKVLRDSPFYGKNGGVTITGGEPMAQYEFTLELAKAVKSAGFSVVVETSGFADSEKYIELAKYCDCFYYDCKADSKRHRELVGADDRLITANLDLLIKNGASVVLRCPIVPSANLTREFIDKIITLGQKYPTLAGISLLPYHSLGVRKSSELGKEIQPRFTEPSRETMDALRDKIRSATACRLV